MSSKSDGMIGSWVKQLLRDVDKRALSSTARRTIMYSNPTRRQVLCQGIFLLSLLIVVLAPDLISARISSMDLVRCRYSPSFTRCPRNRSCYRREPSSIPHFES
jgi:hypothetical protein